MLSAIELKNINLAYGDNTIFKDSSFRIEQGEKIGLIGRNGQGKSTLFKILERELIPDVCTPAFEFIRSKQGHETLYVAQDFLVADHIKIEDAFLEYMPEIKELFSKLSDLEEKLATDYSEKLLNYQQELLEAIDHANAWVIKEKYLSYLAFWGISDIQKNCANLSGGEKRKVLLSIAFSSDKDVILLDEPTNHLDIKTIEKLEDEIMSSSKTFVVISHDRYFLANITNRIFHIHEHQIFRFEGSLLEYFDYLKVKAEEEQKQYVKLKNLYRRELAWMRQGVKARRTRSKKRVEQFEKIEGAVKSKAPKEKKSININENYSYNKTKKLIDFDKVTFSYGEDKILSSLTFSIFKNSRLGIIGPNGCGKSTLIKLMTEALTPTLGEVRVKEGIKISYFRQERETLPMDLTLRDFLTDGSDMIVMSDGKQKHVISLLESFHFRGDQVDRPISTLSGGEKNRLQLLKFLTNQADLFILDEPTNDLDLETISQLEEILADFDGPVIIISHDRSFLKTICKHFFTISKT